MARRIEAHVNPYFAKHECYITNIRADGTRQDSMEGVMIPPDNPFYAIRDGLNQRILRGELEFPPKKRKEG